MCGWTDCDQKKSKLLCVPQEAAKIFSAGSKLSDIIFVNFVLAIYSYYCVCNLLRLQFAKMLEFRTFDRTLHYKKKYKQKSHEYHHNMHQVVPRITSYLRWYNYGQAEAPCLDRKINISTYYEMNLG